MTNQRFRKAIESIRQGHDPLSRLKEPVLIEPVCKMQIFAQPVRDFIAERPEVKGSAFFTVEVVKEKRYLCRDQGAAKEALASLVGTFMPAEYEDSFSLLRADIRLKIYPQAMTLEEKMHTRQLGRSLSIFALF